VVCRGAFSSSLKRYGLPVLLFQHKDTDCPVGVITEAVEDKRGLRIAGELPKDDTFVAGRLVPQLKRRGLKGMSIGYRTLESEKRKSDGARLLKQVRLFECSFVALPMHLDAGLESIKGIAGSDLEELALAMREFCDEAQGLRYEPDPYARLEKALLRMESCASRLVDSE
jgi:uncharacterized protein